MTPFTMVGGVGEFVPEKKQKQKKGGIKSFFTDLFSGLDFSSLDCLNPEEKSPFLHLQYSRQTL